MRIRTIKPEFWTDERLSALPEFSHMLAAALLNYADDEGYFNAHPALVKAACFPLREPSVSIHGALSELSRIGFLVLRPGRDGRQYGRIPGFLKHQRINRPSPSKIKDLADFSEDSVNAHTHLSEHSLPEQGTGNREGKGANLPPPPPGATGGQGSLPIGDTAAPPPPNRTKARERNPLFDALAAATDGDPAKLTDPTARAVGVALAQIRKATPDLTPEEIARRARNYRVHFRDATLTASALAKHWARCESGHGAPAGTPIDPLRGPGGPNGELYKRF